MQRDIAALKAFAQLGGCASVLKDGCMALRHTAIQISLFVSTVAMISLRGERDKVGMREPDGQGPCHCDKCLHAMHTFHLLMGCRPVWGLCKGHYMMG